MKSGVACDYIDLGAGRGRLHYRRAGDPSQPPLLLLHQAPSHSAMYEPLMIALADSFHTLAPDLPGFGGSAPLSAGDTGPAGDVIAAFARAIRAFLDALGLRHCLAFGHHTGAAVAVRLEHDFAGTCRGMALSGPPLLDGDARRALPAAAAPIELAADGSHLLAMWQRLRSKDPDAPLGLTQREVLSALACGDAYQATYGAVARHDFAGQLPGLRCPTLVFAGDEDPLGGAVEPTLALLPRGVGATLPAGRRGEGRTYVCERQAPAVARLLRDFLVPLGAPLVAPQTSAGDTTEGAAAGRGAEQDVSRDAKRGVARDVKRGTANGP